MAWPIVCVIPPLLPSAAVDIRSAQACTGDEAAAGTGCENPTAAYARGMEDADSPHALPKAVTNLTSPSRSSSDSSFATLNRKMEEAGSGHHPGIADPDRREQYSHPGLKGLPTCSLARQDAISCESSPRYLLLSSQQHCLLPVQEREKGTYTLLLPLGRHALP